MTVKDKLVYADTFSGNYLVIYSWMLRRPWKTKKPSLTHSVFAFTRDIQGPATQPTLSEKCPHCSLFVAAHLIIRRTKPFLAIAEIRSPEIVCLILLLLFVNFIDLS